MDEIYKGKTREEIIQLVYDLTLQNTNGRETNEEMYKKGIEACYDELVGDMRYKQGNILLSIVSNNEADLDCDYDLNVKVPFKTKRYKMKVISEVAVCCCKHIDIVLYGSKCKNCGGIICEQQTDC